MHLYSSSIFIRITRKLQETARRTNKLEQRGTPARLCIGGRGNKHMNYQRRRTNLSNLQDIRQCPTSNNHFVAKSAIAYLIPNFLSTNDPCAKN